MAWLSIGACKLSFGLLLLFLMKSRMPLGNILNKWSSRDKKNCDDPGSPCLEHRPRNWLSTRLHSCLSGGCSSSQVGEAVDLEQIDRNLANPELSTYHSSFWRPHCRERRDLPTPRLGHVCSIFCRMVALGCWGELWSFANFATCCLDGETTFFRGLRGGVDW